MRSTPGALATAAMTLFVLVPAAQIGEPPAPNLDAAAAFREITAPRIAGHLTFLADDLLEGRAPGGRGYDLAARYVAAQFAQLGLSPAGADGTFLQPITLRHASADPARSLLTVRGGNQTTLRPGDDVAVDGDPRATTAEASGRVTFVGYGVTAPEAMHDDYAGVDVAGRIVAYLSGAPPAFAADARDYYAGDQVKRAIAAGHGAVGAIAIQPFSDSLVRGSSAAADRETVHWLDADGRPGRAAAGIRASARVARRGASALFAGAPRSVAQAQADAERGRSRSFDLPVSATITSVSRHRNVATANVAAVLRGSRRPDEYVVYTAHLDHVGIGEPVDGDTIYNGALDNAGGVAGLLAVADAFTALPRAPDRSILFLAVTGEETGLLGSDYFVQHPTVAAGSMVANINIDGLPLLYDFRDVVALGAERSTLGAHVDRAASALGLSVAADPMPEQNFFLRSDQYSFARAGIPAVFPYEGPTAVDAAVDGRRAFARWLSTRYHSPQDDLMQPIDYRAGIKGARFLFLIGYFVALDTERPRWHPGEFFGSLPR